MIGGIYFAGAAFAGVLRFGPTAAALAASATISITATADLSRPPARLAAQASIVLTVARADLRVPIDTTAGITIDGVPVTARVRVEGVTIRDILNDAPNTASFTIEGDAPAVGQSVRITMGTRLLFTGSVQTIDQAYELLPKYLAWHLTAIDDTAAANARRPFGNFRDVSATTIAQTITAQFAPGFSTAGIDAGLPPVTITFDGADLFIACLARLATAIGGYCKVFDQTVYLFLEDLEDPPAPIDDTHPFLDDPPIAVNTDSSQLRTRVYGKGYGENVPTDIDAGETLIPIQDGALFPPLGGTAIAGITADGAQSERLAFAGVILGSGGSLVGTGASPTTAPGLELQAGTGITTGLHTVSVAYVTAAGKSIAGPPGSITAGTHAPPATAPTAGTAVNGTGPDQGTHDYAASFVTAYGETVPSPISNAVTTSAASGQVAAPGSPFARFILEPGPQPSDFSAQYQLTFTNANGETEAGLLHPTANQQGPGFPPPINTYSSASSGSGGNLTPQTFYRYFMSHGTASGYETQIGNPIDFQPNPGTANTFVLTPYSDPRITKRRIYRTINNGALPNQGLGGYLVAEHANDSRTWTDTASDASIQGNEVYYLPGQGTPSGPRGTDPGCKIEVTNIPIGPAGVTGRKIYRRIGGAGTAKFVGTLTNNTATTFLDNVLDAALGANIPSSNTTGTAVQQIPITNIPLGPAGVTARKLYRRFNGAGTFKLVTTLANNTGTTYTDALANAALGADALGTATAIGNQIRVTLPIGASAVTGREVYLSPVSGPRRLVATIADNTTASTVLAMADAAITGALEPGADTSGLQQPQGQVNPGATILPVAASAPFRPAGGWVILGGGQVVKHTGISGNTLTGIPAAGSGAITTAVLYGSQALPSPMLTGVTGVTKPMLKGSAIHLWIQRDDLLAQTEHAARTGGDGIVEFLIVDTRRGVPSLTARCDADLAQFARPLVTVAYATRDLKTKSGKTIVIDLPSQRLAETLTIQEVTITQLNIAPNLLPRFTVKASNVRFSLEDTLRRLVAIGPVVGGSTS